MLSQDASKLKYELEKDIFLHKIKNIDNIYSNFDRAGVTHLGSILESVNVPLEFLNYKNSEIGNKNTSTIFPKLNGSNMITFNPSYRIQESNLNLNGSHNRDCNNFLASEAKLASFPTPVYGKIFPLDLASRSIISNGPLVAPTILPPISSTTTKSFQDVWITAGSPKLIDSTDTAYGIIDAPPPTASPQTSNKNLWRRGQLNSPPSTSTGYNEGINI